MFGSRDEESLSRCDWRAEGVVYLNVKEEEGSDEGSVGCGGWRAANMETCCGSRSEASMSASVGFAVCIDGAVGSEIWNEAKASQAAFSSSRLWRVSTGKLWCCNGYRTV